MIDHPSAWGTGLFAVFGGRGGAVRRLRLRNVLLGWLLTEALALLVVVKLVGFGGAVLLSIASSLIGIVVLRRLGMDAARHLRTTLAGRVAAEGKFLDGSLAAFGALLLILPGFASDVVGLLLAAPSGRQYVMRKLGAQVTKAGRRVPDPRPGVIDLAPTDWSVVEPPRFS